MSVPRPAMLVATVTAPLRPAWATTRDSRSCCLAFSTWCGTPPFFSGVNHVRRFDADQIAIRRNDRDVQIVNLAELRRFRFRRSGHAGEFLVHTEIILEGNRGERLVFALDFHAFFGFHGLVQTVGPAAAGHLAARKFIDDDDFAVLYDIIHGVLLL